jgi:crossover junction endodeoxyribonuclease RuvC
VPKTFITLGIDPGISSCGFGLVKCHNNKFELLDSGIIKTNSKNSISEKLQQIFSGLNKIIKNSKPDFLAVEDSFFAKNVKSLKVMSQAKGVILLAGAQAGLSIQEYSTREVKQSVVGRGEASKNQVQYMVKTLLGIKNGQLSEDASDALAVAFCHCQKISDHNQWLHRGVAKGKK